MNLSFCLCVLCVRSAVRPSLICFFEPAKDGNADARPAAERISDAGKSEGPHSAGCRPELMCPDERYPIPRIDRFAGFFFGRSFRTEQNRRKTLRKLMAAIDGGPEPGVWVGTTPSWQSNVF
jgi:hypothetical protein